MEWWSCLYFLANIFLVTTTTTDIGHVRTLDAQQDERIRLECTVTSKLDAEEVCVEYYFLRSNAFTSPTGGESIF